MRWIAACAIGEAIGIAIVSMAYAAGDRSYPEMAGALIIGAGAIEGLALGSAQAFAGRKNGLHFVPWVGATVTAAVIGYGLSFFMQGAASGGDIVQTEPPIAFVLLAGAGLGLLMGVLFGGLQSFVLPSGFSKRSWILRNAIGWAAAMSVIMFAATTAGSDWSLIEVGLSGLAAGAIAGLFVGAATKGGLKQSGD